jgi:ribosome biogenesis GTPase A
MPTGNPNRRIAPHQSKSLLSGRRKKEILKDDRKRRDERRARQMTEEEDERQKRYIQFITPTDELMALPLAQEATDNVPQNVRKSKYIKSNARTRTCSSVREDSNKKGKGGKRDLTSRFADEKSDDIIIRLKSAQSSIAAMTISEMQTNRIPYHPVDLMDVGQYLHIPVRPPWSIDMTKDDLDASESAYFASYRETIERVHPPLSLNKYETNLEVWRQFWRVVERSDILLVLADIRCPLFSFPPSLYHYVVNISHKPVIVVLTKVDLVTADLVARWVAWFQRLYPAISVVPFSSHPDASNTNIEDVSMAAAPSHLAHPGITRVPNSDAHFCRHRARVLKGGKVHTPAGKDELFAALQQAAHRLGRPHFDLSPIKLHRGKNGVPFACDGLAMQVLEEESGEEEGSSKELREEARQESEEEKPFSERATTLGILGLPNAGKSSFINALAGRRVVSVSRTPGHTKHLQTLFLNPHVVLCDSPGLVGPVVNATYPLHVLFGCVNIAQVRETYSTLAYVAERFPLVEAYGLTPHTHSSALCDTCSGEVTKDCQWSGFAIAEAWAQKRGYYTSRSRLDTHRAGNEILRDIVNGRVVFALAPPSDVIETSSSA